MSEFSLSVLMLLATLPIASMHASAQSAPSAHEITEYTGLHAAAQQGNLQETNALLEAGADTENRDPSGRTALHVASFGSQHAVVRRLASAKADLDVAIASEICELGLEGRFTDAERLEQPRPDEYGPAVGLLRHARDHLLIEHE